MTKIDLLRCLVFAALATLSLPAFAQPIVDTVKATDLYAEYKSNPLAADTKYEGRRIEVTGLVISIDFLDIGVGHSRAILLAGEASNSTTESVQACFTESCTSVRRPTISDETFKSMKKGATVSVICNVEPVVFNGNGKSVFVMVLLSKCALP